MKNTDQLTRVLGAGRIVRGIRGGVVGMNDMERARQTLAERLMGWRRVEKKGWGAIWQDDVGFGWASDSWDPFMNIVLASQLRDMMIAKGYTFFIRIFPTGASCECWPRGQELEDHQLGGATVIDDDFTAAEPKAICLAMLYWYDEELALRLLDTLT